MSHGSARSQPRWERPAPSSPPGILQCSRTRPELGKAHPDTILRQEYPVGILYRFVKTLIDLLMIVFMEVTEYISH